MQKNFLGIFSVTRFSQQVQFFIIQIPSTMPSGFFSQQHVGELTQWNITLWLAWKEALLNLGLWYANPMSERPPMIYDPNNFWFLFMDKGVCFWYTLQIICPQTFLVFFFPRSPVRSSSHQPAQVWKVIGFGSTFAIFLKYMGCISSPKNGWVLVEKTRSRRSSVALQYTRFC